MNKLYNSFVRQTLHYFSRPHQSILRQEIQSPSAWNREKIIQNPDLIYTFSSLDRKEVKLAVSDFLASGKALEKMRIEDFPLPGLKLKIKGWREVLNRGCGVQIVKGIPVEDWSPKESEIFFWGLGSHLGIPGAQDKDGQLLGHVKNISSSKEEEKKVRLYKTSAHLGYHCDAADVVGLMCLKKAKQGGTSHLVSSVSIYNEILKIRPDLIDELYSDFYLDTRDSSNENFIKIPPCRYSEGRLRTFYHADYFRSVHLHSNIPEMPQRRKELLDLYDKLSTDPAFQFTMNFVPGDIQLISNHTVIHGRTEFIDHTEEDQKRDLLRLWLSTEYPKGFYSNFLKASGYLHMIKNLLVSKLYCRMNPRQVETS